MKILVDLYHPAHLHLFRKAMKRLQDEGHSVFWVTRDKDITVQLLKAYKLPFKVLTKARKGIVALFWELILHNIKVWREATKHDIDLMIGTSVSIAHASLFCRSKSWVFEEDDAKQAKLMTYLSYPFASKIITPDFLSHENHGLKHVTHPSYHELAYLHPNHFSPDKSILSEVGLKEGEPFFIVRFVSLNASHDFSSKGLALNAKRTLLKKLHSHGRVFITSEGRLDEEFRPYQISIPPHRIHDLIAYCTICIGDSQTMAVEAAVLGVPSVRCNTFVGKLSIFDELDNYYGLTFGFLPNQEKQFFDKIDELLCKKDLKEVWARKRRILLKDKIDLSMWLVNQIKHDLWDKDGKY